MRSCKLKERGWIFMDHPVQKEKLFLGLSRLWKKVHPFETEKIWGDKIYSSSFHIRSSFSRG